MAVEMFLQIPGVKGESGNKTQPKQIDGDFSVQGDKHNPFGIRGQWARRR